MRRFCLPLRTKTDATMKIAIYGNEYQDRYFHSLARLLDLLEQAGVEVMIDRSFYEHLCRQTAISPTASSIIGDGEVPEADLALSVGGDGTFLRTAEKTGLHSIPILGVNTGHLGYLAAVDITDVDGVATFILAGNYSIEERTLLRVGSDVPSITIDHPYALNDIAIMRQDMALMITMHTWVNGQELTTYKGDGLIISTPTGSTAYNLSVGGPILEPTSRCMVLSPVSAHSLTMRPLVLRDDSLISVTTTSRMPRYRISVDGRPFSFPSGSTITVDKAPFRVKVVQMPGHSFSHALRDKLLWGIDRRE